MKRQGITFNYYNHQISHFCFKKIDGSCHIDADYTHLIGVYCKVYCPYYWGIKDDYVVCTHPDLKDDEQSDEIHEFRTEIHNQIEENAYRALDY